MSSDSNHDEIRVIRFISSTRRGGAVVMKLLDLPCEGGEPEVMYVTMPKR